MGNYDSIQIPVGGQPISVSQYGIPVRDAIIDLDERVTTVVDKPLVQLVQQVTQSLADNVATAITFGASSEVIDTDNFHDEVTNNTRITPSIPGYYRATGILWIPGATTQLQIYAAIYKNGTNVCTNRVKHVATSTACSAQVTTIVAMNGTTDYVEFFGYQDDSGGTARSTIVGGAGTASMLDFDYVRPL